MTKLKPKFPLIEAYLLTPEEGKNGSIGICTNTTSPTEVFNEIEENMREEVSVLGSLIVNRDGSERMMLNSLVHPTMKYLILFSEENITFCPSTNLIIALKYGLTDDKQKNIINGQARSAYYPNISKNILEEFKKEMIVLPMFMYRNDQNKKIINEYLQWIKPKIDKSIYDFLVDKNNGEKIYYDSLNKLIKLIKETKKKNAVKKIPRLDPKDFQNLQPQRVEIKDEVNKPIVQFNVSKNNGKIRVDIKIGNDIFFVEDSDEFLMEYSIMKFLGKRKTVLSVREQLFLGAEISRIGTEISNNINVDPFVISPDMKGKMEIPLKPKTELLPDKKFYYRINKKDDGIYVACLSFDVCEQVFELHSEGIYGIFDWLSEKNRFEDYEMDILHRMDIGSQIAKAYIAFNLGYSFIQDFSYMFKINKTDLPLLIADSDSFMDTHKQALRKVYTQGITETHADIQKGSSRTGIVLSIFRNSDEALKKMPLLYKQGEMETKKMRKLYKEQLLRFDHDGNYSYGERTRSYFGIDQLIEISKNIKNKKNKASIIQRFDPIKDMSYYLEEETGKRKYSHDPCLTHDIFFIKGNKLNSFHIARAHNIVNAYPENVFGLYDAYFSKIKNDASLESGDIYILSNRANVLLLTEEQRAKKILSEPSKPIGRIESSSGPYKISKDEEISKNKKTGYVSYISYNMKISKTKPRNDMLKRLEDFEGVNILEKAIKYLKERGENHNNPILTTYQARSDGKWNDFQGEHLIFFQANVFGEKIYSTAVFVNHSISDIKKDKSLINYISTKYGDTLQKPLGEAVIFYIN